MTLRDLLLVLGAVPLLGVVALRLAAEAGLVQAPPPPDALPLSLAAFGVVFVVYVALTLRAIATATRDILARESASASRESSGQRSAAVSDFAIHIDRGNELDLRPEGDGPLEEPDEPEGPIAAGGDPGARRPAAARSELFGEVSDLLTRIPSARSR